MSMIVVENLKVTFGSIDAVRTISFEVPEGDVFGFIGPNGAGKTTTLKVLATLQKPTSGDVIIDGKHLLADPQEIRRVVGYVPDVFGTYDDFTVREFLFFFQAAYGIEASKREQLLTDVLNLTDLQDRVEQKVDTLSRGMKQRLSIARVLLHDPKVLLLDEPASGLDPRARIELRELLKELQKMGKTIIISSHILHELSQLCTCLGILESGRLIAEGSVKEIYQEVGLMRLIHVGLENPTEELRAEVAQIDGVMDVQLQSDRLSIEVQEGKISPAELLHRIQDMGARVYMYQPEALDMETAFIKLTQSP